MSELPPSGAALDKLLAGGGEAELRRRYAADLRAAGLGAPSSAACSLMCARCARAAAANCQRVAGAGLYRAAGGASTTCG